jgi:hypothetical protein
MKCYQCQAAVTMTVKRKRSVGIRCADCLHVFCLDCAWRHFGQKMPKWAEHGGRAVRVKGWKPPPKNMLDFGTSDCRVLRKLRNSGGKLEA